MDIFTLFLHKGNLIKIKHFFFNYFKYFFNRNTIFSWEKFRRSLHRIQVTAEKFISCSRYVDGFWLNEIYIRILSSLQSAHFFHQCCCTSMSLVKKLLPISKKKSHQQNLWRHYKLDTVPWTISFFNVGEHVMIRWGQIRWIGRVNNQLKDTLTHSSYWNQGPVCCSILPIKQPHFICFPGQFVLTVFSNCFSRMT